MNILLLSGTCSALKYRKIFNERIKKFIDPSQKFFLLLLKGLIKHKNINLTCISGLPISGNCHKKKIWKKQIENIDGIKFIYPSFINVSIFRLLTSSITLLYNVIKYCIIYKNTILIYDPIDIRYSIIANIIKRKNIKAIAIITDIPSLATVIGHEKQGKLKKKLQSLYDKIADKMLENADGYIFLTEQMNLLVNKYKKPYVVIEGSVDIDEVYESIRKDNPKSIMYAGGVHEKFGILKLIEAFNKADIPNCELKVYGAGEAVQIVQKMERLNSKIKYMGVVPVEEIIKEEKKATLLVNPRPTNEAFTQYSFPSKTLEYMLSGTPLLTTKLPGIPKDYFDYIFTFESTEVSSMAITLSKILYYDAEKLREIGYEAYKYVKENKNNLIQAKKIISFLEENIND